MEFLFNSTPAVRMGMENGTVFLKMRIWQRFGQIYQLSESHFVMPSSLLVCVASNGLPT